jgi:hypothetical protein
VAEDTEGYKKQIPVTGPTERTVLAIDLAGVGRTGPESSASDKIEHRRWKLGMEMEGSTLWWKKTRGWRKLVAGQVWPPWPLAVSGVAGGNIRLGGWRLLYNHYKRINM